MQTHRTPAHKRKGGRSPRGDASQVNEYAVGKHRAMQLVTWLERIGEKNLIARLKCLLYTQRLTPEQSREVRKELELSLYRRNSLTLVMKRSQDAVQHQLRRAKQPQVKAS